LLKSGRIKKGDAFTVSKIAGIMAVKKTHEMIPLCHPLPLEAIDILFQDDRSTGSVLMECRVETTAKTGVEMEALTAAMMAALTLYDMAKAHDPGMVISNLRLIQKTGGKSDYVA
jgi:cyclic pyranopterin phosphate synthase